MNRTTLTRTSDDEILIERVFGAAPEIVFRAWTEAELVRRWWAPKSLGAVLVSCEAEVREGGRYRYVFTNRGGDTMAFSGRYIEVTRPSRLVYTENFEPVAGEVAPEHDESEEAVITATFEPRGETTLVLLRERFPSKDVLDMVLATGMEKGMQESYDQLDAMVRS